MADLMRNSKKKITVRKALYGPGAFLIACAALIFLMSIFFRVKTVEVRGNSYYTAEEVELASGVVEGDNLFFINRFSVVSRIFTRLPYVEDVSLTRYLPNKVVIEISECQALACVSYEGQSWVIDRNCRMLTQAGPGGGGLTGTGAGHHAPDGRGGRGLRDRAGRYRQARIPLRHP